ncbi:hypothetical protein PRIPAC_83788 [Pristionchus pacificus]|uniref:Uncharacterized protein n=1 Tax=Pristionchus pacificus TaxID=54126 RepID=A0A2A6BVA5_PRIPA|nr:hypothetical protein PRIPAC_83788 [Pristionchus pacificus]|eukprot:PDM69691.1 hypothetical protein PRIPAC_44787 [Pristionchus pacificus]
MLLAAAVPAAADGECAGAAGAAARAAPPAAADPSGAATTAAAAAAVGLGQLLEEFDARDQTFFEILKQRDQRSKIILLTCCSASSTGSVGGCGVNARSSCSRTSCDGETDTQSSAKINDQTLAARSLPIRRLIKDQRSKIKDYPALTGKHGQRLVLGGFRVEQSRLAVSVAASDLFSLLQLEMVY